MAIGKNKIGKLSGLAVIFCTWSAGVFWVGSQSAELIGSPFPIYEAAPKVAKFYPLDKFIFSVPGKDTSHYLMLELALKSRSDDAKEIILNADPLIKNSLMKMFSHKDYEQLNASSQLEVLQTEALTLLVDVLKENDFNIELEDVLFTKMVIQ